MTSISLNAVILFNSTLDSCVKIIIWRHSKESFYSFLQSNVLEAAPDMKRESEKEWYFGNADKERRGPFSFEEVCGLVKM